jgi:hypothetical protein
VADRRRRKLRAILQVADDDAVLLTGRAHAAGSSLIITVGRQKNPRLCAARPVAIARVFAIAIFFVVLVAILITLKQWRRADRD